VPGLVPNLNNDLILGAVGILQFDVAAYRLYEQRWPEIRYLATREL
jgi:peptide subunit release factor RF-3